MLCTFGSIATPVVSFRASELSMESFWQEWAGNAHHARIAFQAHDSLQSSSQPSSYTTNTQRSTLLIIVSILLTPTGTPTTLTSAASLPALRPRALRLEKDVRNLLWKPQVQRATVDYPLILSRI
jgi:hypothetical protein